MNESREHLLISRLAGDEGTEHDWREFEQMAAQNPSLWREFGELRRDHVSLCNAMASATAVADSVSLPNVLSDGRKDRAPVLRLNRLGAWTGWAVAAMVGLMALPHLTAPVGVGPANENDRTQAAGISFPTAAQAFQAYLEKGRESGEVVGEVPTRVLVETKPAPAGAGVEVLYLRQVLERTVVPDLYQLSGQDETGRPTLVRYEQPTRGSM